MIGAHVQRVPLIHLSISIFDMLRAQRTVELDRQCLILLRRRGDQFRQANSVQQARGNPCGKRLFALPVRAGSSAHSASLAVARAL